MAPQRVRKQVASQPSASLDADATTTSAVATPSAMTPERIPASKQTNTITEAQKQALMDNLQLEITERARKLRSQYGLLAQGLRSRLEMRVNRIPTALRKTNIMDLVEKYSDQRAEPPTSTLTRPTPSVRLEPSASTQVSPVEKRGTKRSSEEFLTSHDENAQPEQALSVPKKRTKTTAAQKKAAAPAKSRARTVSRQDQPLQVLSPKSNNSRTYPRSPVKNVDDEKPYDSPTKTALPLKSSVLGPDEERSGKSKAGAGAGRGKRTAAAPKEKRTTRASLASSNGDVATDASTGTTIVKKKAPAKKTTAKGAAATKSAAAKATAAAKKGKENAPAATTGRALRTRAK